MDHSWIGMPSSLDMAIQGILTAALFEWLRRSNLRGGQNPRQEAHDGPSDDEHDILPLHVIDDNPYASPRDLPDRKAA